ncbi:hypothetical protein MRB53_000930 [Persea americana]|uniref:Uncharacterized protein n=1 Tax=Persea americana TaxID=3435 RepID=A0ACC2MQ67_PERAE|nr:hypothetical protein MRB53_000930 [Persea americana]
MSFHKKKLINDPNGSQARKRTRGPNRCIARNHQEERVVWRLNEFGQPIGANGRLLSSFLGIIARDGQKAPINYFDWRKMPMERKMDMWRAVLSKFEIATDEQPRVKKWVFDKICQFWKNWKSKLKKTHYDPFHTTRERLQYRPDRVDPVQWVLLIEFWGTKDGMERSKRNAENCALQTMNHTAGTKSFARIREEEQSSTVAIDNSSEFQIV